MADPDLLPWITLAAILGGIAFALLVRHFLDLDEPEHDGWEGEHERELIDLVVEHGELTRITEDTARLRREELPRGDR
ncbi:hypothetical protein GCM10010174_69840 [Kutzneria viridogrisea]|uniref:Uncharacterized protein n=1 Tax=Kutzneria viridogrisea TaxID=47990 RepID=A0ABR6BAW8_9PSEU|nr:hypothetical protein [Kutzneria viridogrisea]